MRFSLAPESPLELIGRAHRSGEDAWIDGRWFRVYAGGARVDLELKRRIRKAKGLAEADRINPPPRAAP